MQDEDHASAVPPPPLLPFRPNYCDGSRNCNAHTSAPLQVTNKQLTAAWWALPGLRKLQLLLVVVADTQCCKQVAAPLLPARR